MAEKAERAGCLFATGALIGLLADHAKRFPPFASQPM
jgi:hypothetical protein